MPVGRGVLDVAAEARPRVLLTAIVLLLAVVSGTIAAPGAVHASEVGSERTSSVAALSPAYLPGGGLLPPDPYTGGWVNCATFISCGSGYLSWQIDSTGFEVSDGYGYPSSGSDYTVVQAQSDISWELANYGSMISTVSSHYGVPEINIVTETGPETSFGTDGVDDIMQDLSSAWCGGGAGSQSPDTWAQDYANANYASCSSDWIHFISFAAGTAYLLYQSNRYGADFDPGTLGPAYNAGSLVYATTYSCSGDADQWNLVECSGAGLTASYSWNIAVAYNAALGVGGSPLSATYAVTDTSTGQSLYCGDSFNVGDTLQFTVTPAGGTAPYTYFWTFGDGSSGSGSPATHLYDTLGTFNPLVVVNDSSTPTQSVTTGAGCDLTAVGSQVTFVTVPSTVGSIYVWVLGYTDGETAAFPNGGSYPLSYAAPAGYAFGTWGATGGATVASRTSAKTTLNITSDTASTVTLTLVPKVGVTFSSSPPGDATLSLSGTVYADGQQANLTVGEKFPLEATPAAGYRFVQWNVTGTGATVEDPLSNVTNLTTVSMAATSVTAVLVHAVPLAPTGLHVVASTATTIELAWVAPPGGLVGYQLAWENGSAPPASPTSGHQANLSATLRSTNVSGLTSGEEYWFALVGINGTGPGAWSAWTEGATLALPRAPTGLSLVGSGETYAVLSWVAPVGGAAVDSYSLSCSGTSSTQRTGIPSSSAVLNLTGLSTGGTYSCTIAALSGAYTSPPSNALDFTLPSSPGTKPGSGASPLASLLAPPSLYLLAALGSALLAAGALLALRARRRAEPPAPGPPPGPGPEVAGAPPLREPGPTSEPTASEPPPPSLPEPVAAPALAPAPPPPEVLLPPELPLPQ